YKEIFAEAEWKELAKKGAQTQRVLWASTSTKDPSYSDVLYIEELIGPDTVNTIPPQTLEAFRDHGKPKASLEADLDGAQNTMDTLEKVGISMKKVTDDLVTQAVKLFAEPFDKLLNSVDAKCKFVATAEVDPQTYSLPAEIQGPVGARRVAVDRLGRGQLAGLARHHRGPTRARGGFHQPGRRHPRLGLQAR